MSGTAPAIATDIASELAMEFEGCHLAPYYCPSGFPTIGWGRLLSRDRNVPLSDFDQITQEQADDYLVEDMGREHDAVDRLIWVPLSAGQRAALMDFAYNLGAGRLQSSTLRRLINRGDYHLAADQFERWVWGWSPVENRMVKFSGLVRRRQAEADLWLAAG